MKVQSIRFLLRVHIFDAAFRQNGTARARALPAEKRVTSWLRGITQDMCRIKTARHFAWRRTSAETRNLSRRDAFVHKFTSKSNSRELRCYRGGKFLLTDRLLLPGSVTK